MPKMKSGKNIVYSKSEASKRFHIFLMAKKFIVLISLSFLFLSSFVYAQEIHPGSILRIRDYNTEISFSVTHSFSKIEVQNDKVLFDNYWISVKNTNMEITDWFKTDPQKLKFNLTAPTVTPSIVKFYTYDKGKPFKIYKDGTELPEGVVPGWSYDSSTKVLTISLNDTTSLAISIEFLVCNPNGTGPDGLCHQACGASLECEGKTPNTKWCDGNTKKVCDSNCQYSYQNCRTDAYDTDGGLNYLVRGTCYDYDGCNPSTGDCKVTTFADYCSSDYVIEYFVSGSFCSATSYNCKNYGSYYTCSGGVCTSGGGGCPILKVWDGGNFLELGKLDIHSKKGIDKILEKEVEMEPFEKGKYKIILKEASYLSLIGSGSEIDSIRLLDEEGKECKLVSAIHSKEGEVLSLLRNSDDKKIQLKPDQELFLTFEDCSGRKFRFIIEGENWRPPFLKVRGPAEFFAAIGKNITESIRKMISSISDFFK
jgi:hypothetical protein